MKIKCFGCSFTFGSELEFVDKDLNQSLVPGGNTEPCHASWPLLLAEHYQATFENFSYPGAGNLRIMEQVLSQAELDDPAVFLVNWTWLDRFDYVTQDEHWETLRPSQTDKLHENYYKYFYSQYHTMLTNASYIAATITALKDKNIEFVMTLMDKTLFDPIDPDWQDPYALRLMQRFIRPYITWFDDQDFLSWSKKNKFPISDAWHPLEQAHTAAADYMITVFDKQRTGGPAQQVLF